MLFPLLFVSLVCQGLSLESYGNEFITAFPENIAYYHPRQSNRIQINAFYDQTFVTITYNNTSENRTLQSGQTAVVYIQKYIEQYTFQRSFYSVRVTSTKLITVLWISQRGNSVQSNYVQPVKNLGNEYSIPSINYIKMITTLDDTASLLPLNWRCIIINANNITSNVIIHTVSTNTTSNFTLSPYELYQFQTNDSEIRVSSNNAVAVLLTHPCVQTMDCACNMVVNQVLPQNLWGQNFVVPSVRNLTRAWLQVTSTMPVQLSGQNINIVSNSLDLNELQYFRMGSQFISASNNVSVRLITPGFILELMPETMFAGCFLLQLNSTRGEAFIIARTNTTDQVYIDNNLLQNSDWKTIANSSYSSVSVPLSGTHVIWHPSSRIGVYLFERMENGIPYGGPAVILNDDPDLYGCVADPAQFKTTAKRMTWRESNEFCLNDTFELSTLTSASAQDGMTNFLKNYSSPIYFWFGLRRSLLTLEWYWRSGNESNYNVTNPNWDPEHPKEPKDALCAYVWKDNNTTFWKSAPCCSRKMPLCYKKAFNFNDLTF